MADSIKKRGTDLLTKALEFFERCFDRKPCETCGLGYLSLKEIELYMKFCKDYGFQFDPERQATALDALPDAPKTPLTPRFPSTKPDPDYTN